MPNDLLEQEPRSNPVPRPLSTPTAGFLIGVRRGLCRAIGHSRSRASIRRHGDCWFSRCERCSVELVRVGPGIWRERQCDQRRGEPIPAPEVEPEDRSIEQQSDGILRASTLSSGAFTPARGYTVNYFARKHHITRQQARGLIARIGKDRKKLNAAAEGLATGMGAASAIALAISRRSLR